MARQCLIELNGFPTLTELKIRFLALYDALTRMDWLEQHQDKVDYYHKTVECCDDEGRTMEIKGVLQPMEIIKI